MKGQLALKLGHSARFVLAPVPPFDFRLTVRKPAGWTLFNSDEIFEGGTLWTATRLLGRVVGLKLTSSGDVQSPKMTATVFTSARIPKAEVVRIKEALTTLTGSDQDLRGFYAMAEKDAILRHVVKSLYGMHDTQAAYLFNSVVLSICLQMARLERSMAMLDSIRKAYGTAVEFDGRRIVVEPSAETIARLRPSEFAKKCNLGYRAKYLVGSAKVFAAGFPDIFQIMAMPPEAAKEKLMELPGVGDYAADIINPHGGFPIDAWSVDVFSKLFFGEEPQNAREAIESVKDEGLSRWGKFAWLAFFYVAQDLETLSKRLGMSLRMQ